MAHKTQTREQVYQKFEPHAKRAIEVLVEAMEKGNWAIRVGAARTILNKVVPDLKAIEVTGEEGGAIIVTFPPELIGKYNINVNDKSTNTPPDTEQGSTE